MKKINKFLIITIVLTIFYILIGKFIMSDMFTRLPNILFWTTDILYLGCIGASAVVGMVGIRKTYNVEHKIKWVLLLFTIFNTCVFIINLAITIFPKISL